MIILHSLTYRFAIKINIEKFKNDIYDLTYFHEYELECFFKLILTKEVAVGERIA